MSKVNLNDEEKYEAICPECSHRFFIRSVFVLKEKAEVAFDIAARLRKHNNDAIRENQELLKESAKVAAQDTNTIMIRIPGEHPKPHYFLELTHRQYFFLEDLAEELGLGSMRELITIFLKRKAELLDPAATSTVKKD